MNRLAARLCLLALIAWGAGVPAVAWAERWDGALAKLQRAVEREQWKKTYDGSVELRRTAFEKSLDEPVGSGVFERSFQLQAIAAANLGRDSEARWLWAAGASFGDGASPLPPLAGRAAQVLLTAAEPKLAAQRAPGDSQESRPASVATAIRPVYGKRMIRSGLQGKARVEVLVGVDGVPTEPRILDPGIHPPAAALVLESLRGWRFDPALEAGQPVPVRLELEVSYP